jgi:hypothetical protein
VFSQEFDKYINLLATNIYVQSQDETLIGGGNASLNKFSFSNFKKRISERTNTWLDSDPILKGVPFIKWPGETIKGIKKDGALIVQYPFGGKEIGASAKTKFYKVDADKISKEEFELIKSLDIIDRN